MSILVMNMQKIGICVMNRLKLTLCNAMQMVCQNPFKKWYSHQVGAAPKGLWLFAMLKFFRDILTRSMSIPRTLLKWVAEESSLLIENDALM